MSAAAAHDSATRLRAVAEALRRLAAGPGAPQGWSGAAADAYDAASKRLRRRADAVADVLDDLAGRLAAHAADLPTAGAALAQDLRHARLLLEVETSGDPVARATRRALDRVSAATDPVTGRPVEAHLLAYDPDAFRGDGRVVLAAGDPVRAADVAVLVPGLGSDAQGVEAHAVRALAVHLAARRADPDDANAAVAWIGYDAPEGIGVLSERMADEGGALLADAVGDLRAVRAVEPAHVTVVGHSYGATTVALAATGPGGLPADDVVLAGSPGAGDAGSAADLGLRPGHVWVLRNSHDPVAALGTAGPWGLGEDPALDDWGATRLRAESVTRGQDWPGADHASYFRPGEEGLDNLAHVVAGQSGQVTTARPLRDPWWSPPVDPELGRTPAAPGRWPVR